MEEMSNQLMILEEEKKILNAHREKLAILRDGGMLPKGCDEKEAWARMCVGVEMKMRPMQALNGIAIVNGRPTLHTDSIPSIIAASGLLEDQGHEFIGEGDKLACRFWCKKRGLNTIQEWTYSVADARSAGLMNRETWKSHLRKMLFNRARTYCLRNTFPEVLGNMYDTEEATEFSYEEKTNNDLAQPLDEAPRKRARKSKDGISSKTNEIKDLDPENQADEIAPKDVDFEEIEPEKSVTEASPVEEKAAELKKDEPKDPAPALAQPRQESPAKQVPFDLGFGE